MASSFCPGAVVRLRSGGLPMTLSPERLVKDGQWGAVVDDDSSDVPLVVTWMGPDGVLRNETVWSSSLELCSPLPPPAAPAPHESAAPMLRPIDNGARALCDCVFGWGETKDGIRADLFKTWTHCPEQGVREAVRKAVRAHHISPDDVEACVATLVEFLALGKKGIVS
jgi:hypothetical protein